MTVFLFGFLWETETLAMLLFLIVELLFLNKQLLVLYNKNGIGTLINQFYDYYLFMGIMLWMAWEIHPAFAVVPAVFFVHRLNLHIWFYHHIVLWVYYKARGVKRKIMGRHP